MADPLETLMKLVLRHDTLVDVLAQGFAEHAMLIEQGRERCGSHGCKTAATVRHLSLGIRYCDHCAARIIVKAKKSIGTDVDLDMTLLRGVVANEDAWVDLPGAIGVRRAQDLVTLSGYGLEPDVPEPGSPEWQ